MFRYFTLLKRFWMNSLIRELSFRANFIINVVSELAWVAGVLIFLKIIFMNTSDVRGWTEHQYLFLVGTHMIITSLFEAIFFENCWRFSELVRTGDLDFVLLKPASAQFLLSFEKINYSAFANLPVGLALCAHSTLGQGQSIGMKHVALYALALGAGIVILYSLVFMFAITSVWLIRQTGLEQLWFYTTSIARYPAEIYERFLGGVLWFVLVFIIPILLVVNLPANVMVRSFQPVMVVYMVGASVLLLILSSVFFRLALRWYRSASS